MRIIAGKYGGFKLEAPRANSIHPMGERVRGAIFNSLGAQITDARVLDAFAGSGAIGLEAISRGAQSVVFVEKDKRVLAVIKTNLAKLSLDDQDKAQIFALPVEKFVKKFPAERFDLIFADPPYHDLQIKTLQSLPSLLELGGTLVLSTPKQAPEINLPGLIPVKTAVYADAKITYYWRKNN